MGAPLVWVICHLTRQQTRLYWTGDHEDGRRRTEFAGSPGAARGFATEQEALNAFRGEYRPEGSCCSAVEVAA